MRLTSKAKGPTFAWKFAEVQASRESQSRVKIDHCQEKEEEVQGGGSGSGSTAGKEQCWTLKFKEKVKDWDRRGRWKENRCERIPFLTHFLLYFFTSITT